MVRKGSYILIVELCQSRDIVVGALGSVRFDPGIYCYVGSAMGGLDQRLSRHLSKDKKMRWHIDYITSVADEMRAYVTSDDRLTECVLGENVLANGGESAVKGFGCSDCKCQTHLFRLTRDVECEVVSSLSLEPFSPAS